MKLKTWTVGIAVLTLAAAPVFAEESKSQLSFDELVKPVGCDSGCDCGDACGCGSAVGCGGLLSGIGPGYIEDFNTGNLLSIDGWDIGGWSQFGYHDSQTPLSRTYNDGRAFNDVPGNLNMQQQWFYIGKEADGSNGLGFGFRADFIYGTDAQKTQSFGNPPDSFDEGWDHGQYGWAIPQLYGEVAMGDLSVKIGHFFTIVGYEVIPAPQNFFYSHSLTMFNSEPFTHTGVLSTYSGFENLTLYGGWTLGWDTGFDQVGSGNNWIGGFAIDMLEDSVSLTYINTYGNFGARDSTQWTPGGTNLVANNPDNSYSHSIVLDVSLTDRLQYVIQSDLVEYDRVSAITPGNDQYGINQYLFYKFNDAVSFGTRMEWWKSDTLFAPTPLFPEATNTDKMSYYELTTGVNVKLLNNLIVRPEVRKDWIPAIDFDQDMFACDMILTY